MPIRIRIICISAVLCFAMMISKLFYIQIYEGKKYKEMAENQVSEEVMLKPDRGAILDRNGETLTDREDIDEIIAVPAQIRDKQLAAGVISKLCGQYDVEERLENGSKDVLTFEIKDKGLLKMLEGSLPHGVYVYHDTLRYSGDGLAEHVIGYLNANGTGMMGMERDFDQDMKSSDKMIMRVYKDGSDRILPGMDAEFVNKGEDRGFNVKTTLNYRIQQAAEQVMDKYGVNGAVVVLDTNSGEILAMASRPQFDQNEINNSLKRNDAPLINRAMNGYPPGSVFKTIVAAAALEDGRVSTGDHFYCGGSINVKGVTYNCFDKEVHGNIDFKSAYSQSCNVAFIQIGMRAGGEKILEMAQKFGFGEPENIGIDIKQNINLPKANETAGAGIGNLSIGQGSLLVSPLQVADMTAVIANGGYRYKPRLVDSIVDDNGSVLKKVTKSEGYRVIDSEVAKDLCEMMKLAVSEGTGGKADIDGTVAGKTGTAEFNKEKNISHSWFTGFFPYDDPQYVITVMAEGGGVGGGKAAEVFHDVAEDILKIAK
mgnify:CR=1 FL=1